jgi:catechol 2,3-dioxygenase-like lactoylglutathione lyase family enzyme
METPMDMKLELVLVPVTDVDRAKAFYADKLGFTLDVDHTAGDRFRVVQFTPPGSSCSISFGVGITDAAPGTVRGLHLVVEDVAAVHASLSARGVEMDEIHHFEDGQRVPGPDPKHRKYGTYSGFADPDGNIWVLQEVPPPEAPGA